jgi:hypothetical protein
LQKNVRSSLLNSIRTMVQSKVVIETKAKKTRLKREHAECLTEEDAIQQLKEKENTKKIKIKKTEEKKAAAMQKKSTILAKRTAALKNRVVSAESEQIIRTNANNKTIESLNESDKENTPNKKCYLCKTKFKIENKNSSKWLLCEECDNWMCFECVSKSKLSKSVEFVCTKCLKKK